MSVLKKDATDYITAMCQIEEFSKKEVEPSQWIVTYPPQTVEWKKIDWDLFPLLRYDVTKAYTELSKTTKMSYDGFRWSFKRILLNTQLIVPYFPEGYSNYTDYYFFIQSKYEHMLLDMFSLIPCCTMIHKVKDWLSICVHIPPLNLTDRLFSVLYDLQDRGYVNRIKMVYSITYSHPTL